jgi:hypothetical protein
VGISVAPALLVVQTYRHRPIRALWLSLLVAASAVELASCALAGPRFADTSGSTRARDVLWIDPGPIGARDLYWGAGSPDGVPQPPFVFLEENLDGTNPKIRVKDARGTEWSVKFIGPTNEVHAEVAAARLSWAFGYFVDENYFVREGRIEKMGKLKRSSDSIAPDGRFTRARFEKRFEDPTELDESWSLDRNPFKDTRQLSALKLLTGLLHNWDVRPPNLRVLQTGAEDAPERRYVITDLGAAFGRTARGLMGGRSKWDLEAYRAQNFLRKVDEEAVTLEVRSRYPFNGRVPIDHARWFVALASQLTESQVRRAFEASGADPEEINGFTKAFLDKVAQLRSAVESNSNAN